MSFQPINQATFAQGPAAIIAAVVPAAAKTVFTEATTNAVQVLAAVPVGRKFALQKLVIRSAASLVAGRMMLFASSNNGTSAVMVKDIAHALTTVSPTAGAVDIDFGFTDADPYIVEEGFSLYVGSAVAQAANAASVVGRGKVF